MNLKATIESLDYKLINLHEHEFQKDNTTIAFSHIEDLLPFAQIDYTNLKELNHNGIKFKTLSIRDYLKVYKQSLHDGYRREKSNDKDQYKIDKINEIMSK